MKLGVLYLGKSGWIFVRGITLILAALTACDSASKTADQASSQAASQVLDMNNKSKQAAQDIQKQLNQEADKINQATQ
jgi:hypothetical protein